MLNTQDGQTQGQGSFAKSSSDRIRLLKVTAMIMAKTRVIVTHKSVICEGKHTLRRGRERERERCESEEKGQMENSIQVLEAGGKITLMSHGQWGSTEGGGLSLGAQPITEQFTWRSEEFPA